MRHRTLFRPRDSQPNLRRPIIAVVFAFWLFWFSATAISDLLRNPATGPTNVLLRAIVVGPGALLSLGIAAILVSIRRRRFFHGALIAVPLIVAATGIHTVITFQTHLLLFPDDLPRIPVLSVVIGDLLIRLFFFTTISVIILALLYVDDIREREEQISALQALAQSAQLRALRNQLNPHFLFNALNSIVALIGRKDTRRAEDMTHNLADFLRTTLELDPHRMIKLDDELQLQSLYLKIEEARFPDRLEVVVEVADSLRDALVPALITQPLVENSIKYAVARSTQPVTLQINASMNDGRLEIVIEDDGGDADTRLSSGTRTGLVNVSDRLEAHFGDEATFEATRTPSGSFRNVLRFPLLRD